MKVIYNRLIPFRGFKCINLFGVLFVRREHKGRMTDADFNHEAIHTAQMREMLYVFFYLAYIIEWLWRWCKTGNTKAAYYGLSYEWEAYMHEGDADYLAHRKMFNQFNV